MIWRIRIKKRHVLFALIATCYAVSFLFGLMAHAVTISGENGQYEAGEYTGGWNRPGGGIRHVRTGYSVCQLMR